jgi:hypothetical protein
VLRSVDGFEGRAAFKTWLMRILVNTARSRRLREARTVCTPRIGPAAPGQVGTLLPVADQRDIEARLAAVEARVEEVAADAAAARHLAAARDRDLADFGVKVDANRRAINALGEQTAARFDGLERQIRTGFAQAAARSDQLEREMHAGFAQTAARSDGLEREMRSGFAQAAAGQQRIVDLLTHVIDRQGEE